MLQQAQPGQGRFKRGYTLLEVITAVAIVSVLLSVVMAGYKIRVNKARLEESVNEMMSLAQASWDFYNSRGSWPLNPNESGPDLYVYSRYFFSFWG